LAIYKETLKEALIVVVQGYYSTQLFNYNQEHLTCKLNELLSITLEMQKLWINNDRDHNGASLCEVNALVSKIRDAIVKLNELLNRWPNHKTWEVHKEIAAIGEECRGRILAVQAYESNFYKRNISRSSGKISGKIRREGTPTEVIDSYLDTLSETELRSRDLVADIKNKIRLEDITMADGRPIIVGHSTVKDIVYKARKKRKIKSA
jgi:hypothetical protein